MKFMLMYRMKPDHRDAAVKRFQKTGGTAGEGVTILGRWHKAAAGSG